MQVAAVHTVMAAGELRPDSNYTASQALQCDQSRNNAPTLGDAGISAHADVVVR